MGTHRLVMLAAVLSAGVSAPAMAAWDHIGSIDVSAKPDHDTQYGNFGGSIEKLSLRADKATVMCHDVSATFDNGQTSEIFHGNLPRGKDVTVDLPGTQRMVRRIDFNCHANAPRGATVQISADIGRYQDEWRHSSDWDSVWSKAFKWAKLDTKDPNRWVSLGTERFSGPNDVESTMAGARGRDVESIALKPVDSDARCSHVMATFRDGRQAPLSIVQNAKLEANRLYQVDLPGKDRNLTQLDFACHAEGGRSVTIQIYANK